MTALELSRNDTDEFLSFGDEIMDRGAGGGILRSGVTEISGEAGSGKTQLCLILSIENQLRSVRNRNRQTNQKTAYLQCGEGEFPIQRLSQLAASKSAQLENKSVSKHTLLDGVLIEKCYSIEDILEAVTLKIPTMCRDDGVSLLCVDSIGGLARSEFDTTDKEQMFERTSMLFDLGTKLKWLSNTFDVCIVVVNQVSSTVGGLGTTDSTVPIQSFSKFGKELVIGKDGMPQLDDTMHPSLGLAWSHCINTRITLYRKLCFVDDEENIGVGDDNASVSGGVGPKRCMFLQFSPVAPITTTFYQISKDGVKGLISHNLLFETTNK